MAVKWGFRRAGGAKWRENGGTRTPSNVEFPAVSGVVCMSKVGGLDEIYPLTKFLCPLDEVLRLDSGLAQANFGPIPDGPFCILSPKGDGGIPGAVAAHREESKTVEILKFG